MSLENHVTSLTSKTSQLEEAVHAQDRSVHTGSKDEMPRRDLRKIGYGGLRRK